MKLFSRRFLIGALLLCLFTTACNLPIALTPPAEPTLAVTRPVGTRNAVVTPTAFIPVTGLDVISFQCQFCVNNEPHAVLTMMEAASFNVSDPIIGVTCLTAQVINGRRILLCRGAPQTTFHLNVCVDGSNCSQFPVTLEPCPLDPGGAIQAPAATFTALSPPILMTPVDTRVPRGTAIILPTQTGIVSSPATATAIPGITAQPVSGVQRPEDFIRWYFTAVWQSRNYQDLWEHYLTPNFKSKVGSGIFEDYVGWWDSVDRVDVNSVSVIQNDGTRAWVRVNLNFHMKDGRNLNNQEYEYSLLYNPSLGAWMFD